MIDRKLLFFAAVLLVLASIGAMAFGAAHWRDASVISDLRINGRDGVARVEGGRRTTWKGAAAYAVQLSWTGSEGKKRIANGVPITEAYAKEILRGVQFIALAVPIKYSVSKPGLAPVLVPDAARLEAALVARGDLWLWLGLLGVALGGGLIWWVRSRVPIKD